MLAGRKLLLADDSITIQKVVDLTFTDEGVTVVCVDNGREAIERVEEIVPDVVLADVFMPQASGYEVCEFIKQNEKLKHIPVMLLVGSFEPFDEAEARRVGADDILTKPFQSIRGLLEKVGLLTAQPQPPPEELISTAEFPKPTLEEETLSEQQLEFSTADTRPLPPDHPMADSLRGANENVKEPKSMDYPTVDAANVDVPLDLGDFEPASASAVDDFVLDVDLDDIPEYEPRSSSAPVQSRVAEPEPAYAPAYTPATHDWNKTQPMSGELVQEEVADVAGVTEDQFAQTQEFPRVVEALRVPEVRGSLHETIAGEVPVAASSVSADQLSPEIIDAIARRAVEQLSERVVQEIAWEVVPQLAELMIKRQLEEKNS